MSRKELTAIPTIHQNKSKSNSTVPNPFLQPLLHLAPIPRYTSSRKSLREIFFNHLNAKLAHIPSTKRPSFSAATTCLFQVLVEERRTEAVQEKVTRVGLGRHTTISLYFDVTLLASKYWDVQQT